jgi:protein gp37
MTARRGDVESGHWVHQGERGLRHCYAATLARRLKAMGNPRYQHDGPDGPGFGVTLHPDKLTQPLSWRAAPRSAMVPG